MTTTTSARPDVDAARGLLSMLARVAHDLNNCLARVNGKSELALMLDNPERYRSSLEEVLEAGQEARVLVADLQRLVAWHASEEEQIPLGDVLTLASRMSRRKCEQANIDLSTGGKGGMLSASEAAGLVPLVVELIKDTLEARRQQSSNRTLWSLTAFENGRQWGVALETSDFSWPAEVRRAIERAQRTGEEPVGPLAEVVAQLTPRGAKLRLSDNEVELVFSSADS